MARATALGAGFAERNRAKFARARMRSSPGRGTAFEPTEMRGDSKANGSLGSDGSRGAKARTAAQSIRLLPPRSAST